ncbi:esterase/lipase/thioesterase family protein [Actinidia rufa]|uniref:Esterase/lipase/thioesterase family protein n=1 Tax=Actinidia rufa TaxID=165716 RepID=A0A7J0EVX2_9ERIC|nr:esterase/lipase/thioesterase family protein [Actinidia rufa]
MEFLLLERERIGSLVNVGNGKLNTSVAEDKKGEDVFEKMEVSWDDGYGNKSVKDCLDNAKDIIRPDSGPPQWFCPVECGCPLKDSPVLFFLPGMDGLGLGLILHHKALGKKRKEIEDRHPRQFYGCVGSFNPSAFEVRCLHIPVSDRTPFEGLVKHVEETARLEHVSSPKEPIYLVGDSLGGCLALAVAACNPAIDLMTCWCQYLVLVTDVFNLPFQQHLFGRSQLQPLFPLLEAMPDELHITFPYLLSFIMGILPTRPTNPGDQSHRPQAGGSFKVGVKPRDPMKMAMVGIENSLPPAVGLAQLSGNVTALLPLLSVRPVSTILKFFIEY